MINIEDLVFHYKNKKNVMNHLNLALEKNQKVSIIGKSGCGKTTLLLLLAGILKSDSGRIQINGDILEDVRNKTGIIFQNGGLFPWKTVYGNCALGLKARNFEKNEVEEKVIRVLKSLEIENLKDQYIKNLSGGQKQRVAIARTLVLDSDLLLFDEPSASLDAFTKENFQNLLLNIYQNYSLCSIVVTHDIEEAVYLGQKIIVMNDGEIIEIVNNNKLFGDKTAKKSLDFYKKCIEIRKKLD